MDNLSLRRTLAVPYMSTVVLKTINAGNWQILEFSLGFGQLEAATDCGSGAHLSGLVQLHYIQTRGQVNILVHHLEIREVVGPEKDRRTRR